jgi:hypothetical protein
MLKMRRPAFHNYRPDVWSPPLPPTLRCYFPALPLARSGPNTLLPLAHPTFLLAHSLTNLAPAPA